MLGHSRTLPALGQNTYEGPKAFAMPKRSEHWFRIGPICSDFRAAHVREWAELRWGRAFLHSVRGIWRATVGGEVGSEGRNHNAKVLARCGRARKADPFCAGGRSVRHTTAILLLLAIASLTAWCIGPETVIQKRVSEVRLTL